MTDTELLDWQERVKAQVWHDKKTDKWTLFLPMFGVDRRTRALPIQPTEPTLRRVLHEGYNQWRSRNE